MPGALHQRPGALHRDGSCKVRAMAAWLAASIVCGIMIAAGITVAGGGRMPPLLRAAAGAGRALRLTAARSEPASALSLTGSLRVSIGRRGFPLRVEDPDPLTVSI